jgi:hypothetical protein
MHPQQTQCKKILSLVVSEGHHQGGNKHGESFSNKKGKSDRKEIHQNARRPMKA